MINIEISSQTDELRDQKIGFLTVGDQVRNLREHPLLYDTKSSYLRQGIVRECFCSCGKVILLSEAIIKMRRIKSCGCWQQYRRQKTWEKKQRLLDIKKKIIDYENQVNHLSTKLDLMRFHPLGGAQNKDGMLKTGKDLQKYKTLLAGARRNYTSTKKQKILMDK